MADTARSLTFQNVRTALAKCDTSEMNKLIDLLTTGRIYPRNDAMLATSRGKFGNLATDIPQVLNMSQLPWGFLPTLKQIKDILKQSLVINDDVRLTPSANFVKSDPQVIKQVVNAIENPEFAGNGGSIYGLACEELNQMWTNPKLGMQWQAAVEKSTFECDIMPRGTHQELDFNNIHDVSILLSGLRVWVVGGRFHDARHHASEYPGPRHVTRKPLLLAGRTEALTYRQRRRRVYSPRGESWAAALASRPHRRCSPRHYVASSPA